MIPTEDAPPGSTHLIVPLHDDGPALWPGYIPLSDLDSAHKGLGTPLYETMFQGRRGGLAGQIIVPEYFRYFEGSPPGQTIMAVDPAISQKQQADETAIAVGNVADDLLFMRYFWHGRIGVKATVEQIARIWSFYKPMVIAIEAVAYQTALIQWVENDHPNLPIEPVSPDRDKFSRFLALAGLYEFGRVYHHPTMKGSAAEYQLTHLPNGRHDDIADAFCYIAEVAGLAGTTVVSENRPPGFR